MSRQTQPMPPHRPPRDLLGSLVSDELSEIESLFEGRTGATPPSGARWVVMSDDLRHIATVTADTYFFAQREGCALFGLEPQRVHARRFADTH
jgi:hypothetical protein